MFYYLSIRRRQDSLRHNLTHGVMMREKGGTCGVGMGHFVDRWAGNAQRGVGRVECGHVSRRQVVEVRSGALGIYIRPVTYCALLFSWHHLSETRALAERLYLQY